MSSCTLFSRLYQLGKGTIKTLQIGLEWFPDRAGGLDRIYYDCTRYLPQVGVEVRGLVAGSAKVAQDTGGQILIDLLHFFMVTCT